MLFKVHCYYNTLCCCIALTSKYSVSTKLVHARLPLSKWTEVTVKSVNSKQNTCVILGIRHVHNPKCHENVKSLLHPTITGSTNQHMWPHTLCHRSTPDTYISVLHGSRPSKQMLSAKTHTACKWRGWRSMRSVCSDATCSQEEWLPQGALAGLSACFQPKVKVVQWKHEESTACLLYPITVQFPPKGC